MTVNLSQRAGFPQELTANMTGSYVKIGTLLFNPVVIVFNNQSDNQVTISVDGSTTWMTFVPNQAYVLDLRCQHGAAPNYTMDVGTTFYGSGSSGAFSISYIYAKT